MISMDTRVVIFLLAVSSFCSCNARDLPANHVNGRSAISSVMQSHDVLTLGEAQHEGAVIKNEKICAMCDEFATKALNYLLDNKTQTEIIDILHESCSRIGPYKQQASQMHAEDFCRKFGLCEGGGISIYQHRSKDKCDVCHDFVTQALTKLKDPDTEMEIVQLLLKACDSIGQTVKKCKRLVFEYAPVILVNAEQFLEKNDVCTMLHVCDSTTTVDTKEISTSMHAEA